MHLGELVELAALVSNHGAALISSGGRLSPGAVEEYWTASKCRLDRWGRALKRLAHGPGGTTVPAGSTRRAVRPLLEEILVSEVLTRVWSGVACAFDRHWHTDQFGPIARSVYIGHLEARHRALTLMVHAPGVAAGDALRLNRLRRRTERWIDLLVGHLLTDYEVAEFAVDEQRARDFADDLDVQRRHGTGEQAWSLTLSSLRVAFRRNLSSMAPNADLNGKIAASIVSCFPPEAFDASGLFRSAWLARLTTVADDTQGLIDQLLAADGPA